MMTTAELNRRNEAIALFDGWVKWKTNAAGYQDYFDDAEGNRRHISKFTYDRSWDALMPVVEKIRRELKGLGFLQDESNSVMSWVDSRIGNDWRLYYWYSKDGKYNGSAEKVTKADSYRTAYFLAVSDYCLSLIETPNV